MLSPKKMELARLTVETGSIAGAARELGMSPRGGQYVVERDAAVEEEIERIRKELGTEMQRAAPRHYRTLEALADNADNAKIRYLAAKELMALAGWRGQQRGAMTVNIQINGYLPPGVEGSLKAAMGMDIVDRSEDAP